MKRAGGWPGDVVYIEVSGPRRSTFLHRQPGPGCGWQISAAAGAGYRARARGAQLEKLRAVAAEGGWQLCVAARRGPGVRCAFLLHRPGLLVGAALFLCLVRWLTGFVWQIYFGSLDAGGTATIPCGACAARRLGRRLACAAKAAGCAGCAGQRHAGAWLGQPQLCRGLPFVWSRPCGISSRYSRTRRLGALYAKAGGQVVSVLLQSGFASVEPGQYVAQGQLLANGQKADRQGDAVEQAAAGQVIARMGKSYTAVQPLAQQARLLTARARNRRSGMFWTGRSAGQKIQRKKKRAPRKKARSARQYGSRCVWGASRCRPLCAGPAIG